MISGSIICKTGGVRASLLACSVQLAPHQRASANPRCDWLICGKSSRLGELKRDSRRSGMEKPGKIAPPKGKLGVLLPGMGAVSTTFMAGVELVRKGKAQPGGSLTQLWTIRLGKRSGEQTAGLQSPPELVSR